MPLAPFQEPNRSPGWERAQKDWGSVTPSFLCALLPPQPCPLPQPCPTLGEMRRENGTREASLARPLPRWQEQFWVWQAGGRWQTCSSSSLHRGSLSQRGRGMTCLHAQPASGMGVEWAFSPRHGAPAGKLGQRGAEDTQLPVVGRRPEAVILGMRSGQSPRPRPSTSERKLAEEPQVGVPPHPAPAEASSQGHVTEDV